MNKMKIWNIGIMNEQTGEEETHIVALATPKEDIEEFALDIANKFATFFEGYTVKQMSCLSDEHAEHMAIDVEEWA